MEFIRIFQQLRRTTALIVIFGLCITSANYTQIKGVREPCQLEGEPVAVDHIDKFRCFSCICKNGFVECRSDYHCPPIEGCHMLAEKTKDGCCQKCKGCMYKGVHYQSHTEWTDSKEPCKVIRCEAGVVTESDLQCYTPCANPLPPEPGKCCSTCPDCKLNGQVTTDDRDVILDDPCLKCRCSKGGMICSKKACPVLQCIRSRQRHPPNECCPRCSGTRSLMTVPKSCILQSSFVKHGQEFNIDRCTNCSCLNETSVCRRNACPILDCSVELQKNVPGNCCKQCTLPEEIRSTQCIYDEKVYEDGQSWRMDACRSCKCHNGMPSCAMVRCNLTLPCSPGTKLVKLPDECCEKCEEVDGVCMVFGDPHYKTFDGKLYTFQGVGKYELVSDCIAQTFSVRVANTYSRVIPHTTNNKLGRTSTKRVTIKYGDIRINLQQRTRIKLNGKLIRLPFKKDGKVRIEKVHNYIEVSLQNKVKIIWSGRSFLEVSVPATFKNKLCGLCGNFNANVQDDLKPRRGDIMRDEQINAFGGSWCIGTRPNCTKQRRQTAKIKPCISSRQGQNYCKYLTNRNVVGTCNSVINYSKYYKTCIMDMCNCGSEKCYCESVMAYARECERLGVKLNNWQKHSLCYAQAAKKKKNVGRKSFTTEDIERYRQLNQNRTTKNRKPLLIH